MILGNPLSIPLKVAGTISGLAGHGRKRKTHRRRVGRGLGLYPKNLKPLFYGGIRKIPPLQPMRFPRMSGSGLLNY